MKRFTIILLSVACLAISCGRRGGGTVEPGVQKDTVYPLGFRTEDFAVDSSKVRDGETFSGLMNRMGLGTRLCWSFLAFVGLAAGKIIIGAITADTVHGQAPGFLEFFDGCHRQRAAIAIRRTFEEALLNQKFLYVAHSLACGTLLYQYRGSRRDCRTTHEYQGK